MGSSRRTLWILIGVIALFTLAASWLDSRMPAEPDFGIMVCILGGMIPITTNRVFQECWRSLRRLDQALLILAWYALFVAAVVYHNRRVPSPAGLDITVCAATPIMGAVLYLLYRAFSKSMDALWLRVTRR
jgi:hypothetical protein